MQDVRPIRATARATPGSPPAAPPAQLAERRRRAACDTVSQQLAAMPEVSDHYQATPLHAGDASFLRTGYGPDLLRGLRRGKWPVEASLDLHGATLDQARRNLDEFLAACLTHQAKCVRIVHGKGYGSRNGKPVLKDTVRRWLSQLGCVCAYVECQERDGGTGAVQVLLRIAKQTGIRS
ncbi:MAG: Smr/MutS family protein [Alcaligenaceae bacterium]|nr:Smr/MutS family protein [Alcaligenaceae bacterium]